MRKSIYFTIFALFLLGFLPLISAETIISDANVSYDSDLLRAFNDSDYVNELMQQENFMGLEIIDNEVWARVTVILRDNSGIIVTGTKAERRELINQKIEWIKNETEKFLSNFPGEYIKDLRISSGGFRGFIPKGGFERLLEEEKIEKITWPQYKPELISREGFSSTMWGFLVVLILLLVVMFIFLLVKKRTKSK